MLILGMYTILILKCGNQPDKNVMLSEIVNLLT